MIIDYYLPIFVMFERRFSCYWILRVSQKFINKVLRAQYRLWQLWQISFGKQIPSHVFSGEKLYSVIDALLCGLWCITSFNWLKIIMWVCTMLIEQRDCMFKSIELYSISIFFLSLSHQHSIEFTFGSTFLTFQIQRRCRIVQFHRCKMFDCTARDKCNKLCP